jgi:hypothetical protein
LGSWGRRVRLKGTILSRLGRGCSATGAGCTRRKSALPDSRLFYAELFSPPSSLALPLSGRSPGTVFHIHSPFLLDLCCRVERPSLTSFSCRREHTRSPLRTFRRRPVPHSHTPTARTHRDPHGWTRPIPELTAAPTPTPLWTGTAGAADAQRTAPH